MRTPILICLLSASTVCMGQGVIPYHNLDPADATAPPVAIMEGVPFPLDKYIRITTGSPYFSDSWMHGKVLLENGAISGMLDLKLNMLDNTVLYLDPKGQEMVITAPLRYATMTDSAGEPYYFLHGDQLTDEKDLKDTWFQVLVNGSVSLCKHTRKGVRESKSYGSATTEQSIQTSETFYVKRKKDLIRIKKWDDLLTLLDDKKELVSAYSKTHHLNGKTQSDFIAVMTYYNSLQ